MIVENVDSLKIHKLTQEQYDAALSAGSLDENALYLTPNSSDNIIANIDLQELRKEMGLGDTLGALPVENGGTGATSFEHTHDATDITAGTLAASLLPLATTTSVGGVKVGDGLSIANGILSAVGSGCKFGHGSSLPSDYVAFIGFLTYKQSYSGTDGYNINICYGYGSTKYTLVPTQYSSSSSSELTVLKRTSGLVYGTTYSNSAYYFYWTA